MDLGLTFSKVVAEDIVILTIRSAIQDGKLGELSVDASSIVGILPVVRSTTATPTSKTTAVTSSGTFPAKIFVSFANRKNPLATTLILKLIP